MRNCVKCKSRDPTFRPYMRYNKIALFFFRKKKKEKRCLGNMMMRGKKNKENFILPSRGMENTEFLH